MENTFTGEVDLRPTFQSRPKISHIVFDFDGTVSWVRHGWPEIMFDVFARYLPAKAGESDASRRIVMEDIVFGLNGRPTVVQMQRFSEIVAERGGPTYEAEALRTDRKSVV